MENSSYSNHKYHLQELSDTNYQVAKGDSDIRDWEAVDNEANLLGKVRELVFDTSAKKVRYLVLALQDPSVQTESSEVLVPLGMTQVLEDARMVKLPSVSLQHLMALPPYEKGQLTQEIETKVLRVFAGEPSIQIEQQNPALTSVANAHGNQNNHKPDTDSPYPRQVAFDRTITEAEFGSFQESSIVLVEKMEEPILSVAPFVVEEIVVGKEVQVQEETIYASTKHTEIDIEHYTNQDHLGEPASNPLT